MRRLFFLVFATALISGCGSDSSDGGGAEPKAAAEEKTTKEPKPAAAKGTGRPS